MNEITVTRVFELALVGLNFLLILSNLFVANSLFTLLLFFIATLFYLWTILFNKKSRMLNALAYISEVLIIIYLMYGNSSLGVIARDRMSVTNSIAICIVVIFVLITFLRLQRQAR